MRKYLNLIQLSRALVPLFVILLHAKAFMNVHFHYDFLNLSEVSRSGGVYYFFALSGFMIYYIYRKEFGNQRIVKKYLYSRFIRIYPIYWILTLCIIPIYFILPSLGSGEERSMGKIITSFLLLPYRSWPILSVAWSLVHTIFFYILFSLYFFKNKLISVVVPFIWIIISCAFSLNLLSSSNYLISFLFNFNNLIFILGATCAFLVTRIKINSYLSVFFLIIGILGFPMSWINTQLMLINIDLQLLTTLSSILLIIGLSSIDLQKEIKLPRFAKFIGDASFSIYLTHYTCMSAISMLLSSTPLVLIPNFIKALLLIILSIICGCLVYLFLEKPIYRKFKSLQQSRQIQNPQLVNSSKNLTDNS